MAGAEQVVELKVLQGLLVCGFFPPQRPLLWFFLFFDLFELRADVRRGVVRENGPGEDLGSRGEKWGVWAWRRMWCPLNYSGCSRVSLWEQRVSLWGPRRSFVERSTSKLNMNSIE
ncbi:hypothetical protein Nmel_014474, partial [Mimus melanotis]